MKRHLFPLRWKPATRLALALLAPALLGAAIAIPAAALPPASVDVTIDKVSSIVDGDFVFATMAGETQLEDKLGRLALDIFLTNEEAFAVEVVRVTLYFDDPASSQVFQGALRMRCDDDSYLRQDLGQELMMPPGVPCRLGVLPDPLLNLPAPGKLQIAIAFEVDDQPIFLGELLTERDLRPYLNDTPNGSYRFPIRAEDLPPGTFLSSRSPTPNSSHRFGGDVTEIYGYDIVVVRYDGSDWVSTEEPLIGETSLDDKDDHLIWEIPVYAVADGIVANCGRDRPDDASTNSPNWFNIYHGEELLRYSHLKQWSPPAELCVEDAVIKEGDLLGVVGFSGMTSTPHLHFEARRDGEPVPLLINDAFLLDRENNFPDPPYGNALWARMDPAAFTLNATVMWPSGLRRRGTASGVGIDATSLASPSSTRTVVASKTTSDNLKVSLYATGVDGLPAHLATDNGGAVKKVSLAIPSGTTNAALAMITGSDALKIAAYDFGTSSLTRTVEWTDSNATDVVAAQGNFTDGIVTAVRTQFGNLKVIAWEVDADGSPSIDRRGEDVGGAVEEIAIARTHTFPGVITALRLPNNRLKLVTWRVSSNGNTVEREDEIEDALVQQISIVRLGSVGFGDRIVTAVKTLGGDLELVSWSVASDGTITRLEDLQAGEITEVSASRVGNYHLLTAMGNDDGDYKLIAWHVAADGSFTRRSETLGGEASLIRQDHVKGNPSMSITALADGSGDLKLIAHEVLLTDW